MPWTPGCDPKLKRQVERGEAAVKAHKTKLAARPATEEVQQLQDALQACVLAIARSGVEAFGCREAHTQGERALAMTRDTIAKVQRLHDDVAAYEFR